MRALRKSVGVSWTCRLLFVQAALYLLAARIAVASLPIRRLLAAPSVRPVPRLSSERILWAIRAASARIPYSTCLVRALAARHLLARNGYPSDLRIGVSGIAGFRAHAWLEDRGRAILGASSEPYTPLALQPWALARTASPRGQEAIR